MTNIGLQLNKGKKPNGVEKIEKAKMQMLPNTKGIITSDDAVVEVKLILLIDEYDVKEDTEQQLEN